MKKLLAVLAIAGTLVACNNESESATTSDSTTTTITTDENTTVSPTDTSGSMMNTDTSVRDSTRN